MLAVCGARAHRAGGSLTRGAHPASVPVMSSIPSAGTSDGRAQAARRRRVALAVLVTLAVLLVVQMLALAFDIAGLGYVAFGVLVVVVVLWFWLRRQGMVR